MKRIIPAFLFLCLAAGQLVAQSLEDLNIQLHGYATQGFIYTTNNDWNTTSSSDGSPEWTEAVLSVTSQPDPKLRIGFQARYFVLGRLGQNLTLDWALGDYRYNDALGVRFGRVKSPVGLFNEIQDIDPAVVWSTLPQSVYALTTRTLTLSLDGAVAYGTIPLGAKGGSLEYYALGGAKTIPSDDPSTQVLKGDGIQALDGPTFKSEGGSLRWRTPLPGLLLGAAAVTTQSDKATLSAVTPQGLTLTGTWKPGNNTIPTYWGKFERGRYFLAAEGRRTSLPSVLTVGTQVTSIYQDLRAWYGMGTYRISDKLTAGLYFSSIFDRKAPLSPIRYQKDWAISARYFFNPYIYAKAEQHFMDGTLGGFADARNYNSLKPDTRMTMLKLGVSF